MSIINNNEFLQEQLDLIKAKKNNPNIEWQDVADFRADYYGELEHRDTVRKGSKLLQEYIDAGWTISPTSFTIPNQKLELQKERIKIQTEKLEMNKWIRELARDEMIMDNIVSAINNLESLDVPDKIEITPDSKGYLLAFGDSHLGTEYIIKDLFGNIINEYSPEIFEERMWIMFEKVCEIIRKENISVLNIVDLGDQLDGILRQSQLMKLRYGVVDASIKYANFLSEWLNELTKYVNVRFASTSGNHTELRMINAPKGTFVNENMDKIIVEFIKERLKDNPNFTYVENPTRFAYFQIACNTVLCMHGEVKNMSNALKDYSQIYGVPIQYLVAGHMHHGKTEEVGINTEVINVPSIIGIDEYSMSLRKTSNAGAKLMVFSNTDGLICDYRIKLN